MAAEGGVSADEIASFGPFRLSVAGRSLTRGGEPVNVGARALDILIALVARAGSVVSRRELMERVWPDVVVEEGTVRVHLSHLRKALGDGKDGARYIVSVPGRGYSFVSPVKWSAAGPVGGSARPQKLLPRAPRMIGRDGTVAELSALLLARRFVSIVGPGGMGKTTVAIAVAHALAPRFADGVAFVDLGSLDDPLLATGAVSSALGLYQQNEGAGPAALLIDRPVLLVLDNCEHVIDAVAGLSERLHRNSPLVHILTTSREALRVEGEHVHLLHPLDAPVGGPGMTAAEALASPAVQLFMERAEASGQSAPLTDADARLVADICRQLDGVALAIELAAGRVGSYGLRGTAELLESRFKLMWQGRRSAVPRHQTLQAMLDWSYNLISDGERTLLRRLSVFVGPFTLDDAVAVAGYDGANDGSVAETVAVLVDKSLVQTVELGGSVYYRLLGITRLYALGKLNEIGEEAELARRHALHYATRFRSDAGGSPLFGRGDIAAFEPRIGNIRAALEWSFSPSGDALVGLELASGAAPLFLRLSLFRECELWCQRGLAALGQPHRGTTLEIGLQEALAISSMYTRGGGDEVKRVLERGVLLAEARGNRAHQLHRLAGLNIFLTWIGDFRGALASAERGLLLATEIGDPRGVVVAEYMLGVAHHLVGDQVVAQRHCERGLQLHATIGGEPIDFFGYDHRIRALVVLSRCLWLAGLPEQALAMADSAVEEARRREQPISTCISLVYTIPVYFWTGSLDRAAARIEQLLSHTAIYSFAPYRVVGLGLSAELEILRGDAAAGVKLLRSALTALNAERHHILATEFGRALAEGLLRCADPSGAAIAIERALSVSEQAGGTFDLPDLLRVQAEVKLAQSPPDDAAAEAALSRALSIAQTQGATGWGLRAAISLAGLKARRGRAQEAVDLLRERLQPFADGCDSADIRTANALLSECLASPA